MNWLRLGPQSLEIPLPTQYKMCEPVAHCLKALVSTLLGQMQANGGALPAMTGSVPGRGRDQYGGKRQSKADEDD